MTKIGLVTSNYNFNNINTGSTKFSILLAKILIEQNHKIEMLIPWATDPRSRYNPFIKESRPEMEVFDGLYLKKFSLVWWKNIPSLFFTKILNTQFNFYKINTFNYFMTYTGPHFKDIENYIIKENFDVIHINSLPFRYFIEIPKKLKKLGYKGRIILTPFFHNEKKEFFNPIYEEAFKLADKIHVVSDFEKRALSKIFKINKSKIETIPLFIDQSEYENERYLEAEVSNFKSKYNLKNKFLILSIYTASENTKGMQETIKAINSLGFKDIVLLVIGSDEEKISDDGRIVMLGKVYGKLKSTIFCSCDIFCMPSKIESFGLVYIEAWRYKKPVIAWDLPQLQYLKEGGLLATAYSIESLASKIKTLYLNKNKRYKIGLNGFNKLSNFYTKEKVKKKYVNLFYL